MDLSAHYSIVTKIQAAQTGGHIKLTRGVEVFYGDTKISFVPRRIDAHTIFDQGLEGIGTAAHIYQPF